MRNMNWTGVVASGGFESLPEGAYVVRITEVADDTQKELLELTYDIAEGKWAGHYNDEWGATNKWAHQFSRWYGEASEGSFKAFLDAVEASNPSFSIQHWQDAGCPVLAFENRLIGVVLRKRIYIPTRGKNAGTVQETLEVGKVISAQDVRDGNWELLPPRDTTKGQAAKAQQPQAKPAGAYSSMFGGQQAQQPQASQPSFDVAYAQGVTPPWDA